LVVTGHFGRQFVQDVGLHLDELHDGVAAKAVPIQHQRGVVLRGAAIGMGTWSSGDDLAPVAQAHLFVEALDGFVFGLQPQVPVPARVLVERGLGEIAAQAVVNLPRDELRMAAQRLAMFSTMRLE
jgi:hypothetical protein